MGPVTVTMGVDIGKKRDPTAICVTEKAPRKGHEHSFVRHLERLPLGTSYPNVAERITAIARQVEDRTRHPLPLFIDATGVGQPVIDILRSQSLGHGQLVEVTLTAGMKCRRKSASSLSLGKARLVQQLQALLNAGRLHLPKNSESEALAQELMNYEIRIQRNAHARFGAFRTGTHDDLVTALGLSLQTLSRTARIPNPVSD